MTKAEFLLQYNGLIALTVGVGVISWTVLILQALFHDKRMALVDVFGSLLFSFTFLFPRFIPQLIKYTATTVCLLFFIWFVLKNFRKAEVYLSAMGVVLSWVAGYWLYDVYQSAGKVRALSAVNHE